jgi:hypothetical protein
LIAPGKIGMLTLIIPLVRLLVFSIGRETHEWKMPHRYPDGHDRRLLSPVED